jgi:hypothetical protein
LESQNNLSICYYIEIIPDRRKCFDLKKFENASFFSLKSKPSDIESANTFNRCKVSAQSILKKLPEGEYMLGYYRLDVFNETGQYMVRIESVFTTGIMMSMSA